MAPIDSSSSYICNERFSTQNEMICLFHGEIFMDSSDFVCLCFTSLQQRVHLMTALPFTVPCEGREAR